MKNYPRLKDVVASSDYRLILTFSNNEKREYDFTPNLEHGYYAPLKEIGLFTKVMVNDGEIEWETGQDFCPHTLYENSTLIS